MSYLPWWDAGFEALVSIIPPGATIAPTSTIKPASCGKAPGLPTTAGWVGYDWTHRTPSRDNVMAWRGTGANLGLRLDGYPAIDIDILDADLAEMVESMAVARFGDAPCRTGRAPKRLLLYRSASPLPKRRLEWMMDGYDKPQAVEMLGKGNQAVVEGIHPATMQPYTWAPIHPVLFGAEGLVEITPEAVDAFFEDLRAALDLFGHPARESCEDATERQEVAQEQLAGDVAAIAAAVAAIPNTKDSHPTREDYIRMGAAIKAALPEHESEAFEIWCEWADRWEGGSNDDTEGDWKRLRPPFEIGAQYLFDLAARYGDTTHSAAVFTFEDEPEEREVAPVAMPGDVTVIGSDAWLTSRFIRQHAHEMRYCPTLQSWMAWDGVRWLKDDRGLVASWAAQVGRASADDARDAAATPADSRGAAKWCNSERAVQNMLAYASRYQPLVASAEEFDADPWLLNTPDGILNLHTGALGPSDPAKLMTKCTTVGVSHETPTRFLAFIEEATGGDLALRQYLQRLFGYALTGVTNEEMLAFFWGSGGNGKSTLLDAVQRILGNYAVTASMDTFTASAFDRHPTDLAALAGARLVVANETQDGRAWDDAKIKALTGSDPVTARFMRQDFFTYQPQFKLVFAGNHRPELTSPDKAMARRFQLVPFDKVPKQVDMQLKDRLRKEYAAILGWMVEGCLAWQQQGLTPPIAVLESTREYMQEWNPVGRWFEERVEFCEGVIGVQTKDLFASYRSWCMAEGVEPGAQNGFARSLKRIPGVVGNWRHPETRDRGFLGIRLRTGAPDDRAVMLLGESLPAQTSATLQ